MKQEFKSESKQLLNLMIHSIYSNKDIFLREIISNASDAIDKKNYLKATGATVNDQDNQIRIKINKETRELTIIDTGVGMNQTDLENNLGVIAHSGSKEFIEKLKNNTDEIDVIGQFGVGFYSSFIVADYVTVTTKKANEPGFIWTSDGVDSYEITTTEIDVDQTAITLKIKSGTEFDKYLEQNEIEALVKKHSDYVKYPIMLLKEINVDNENTDEDTVSALEYQQINSQIALWKKDKKDVTEDEYQTFYQNNYMQFDKPIRTIHKKIEGIATNDLLLYIPSEKPFDYYTANYKMGIDLYSKGILIDSKIDYLIPEYFNFVRGLVDSADLELNISRELLQKDKKVSKIQKLISNTVKKELTKLMKKNREDYEKFYENFGRTLMFGIYDKYGANKDEIKDLIMFKSNKDNKYVSLQEYIEKNSEQKAIYYIAGQSIDAINTMPIMEKVNKKEIEVIYLLNDIDEFALQILCSYNDVEIKSINTAELDTNEEKEELEAQTNENKELLDELKDALDGSVSEVKLTNKLASSLATISNKEGISIEQEKLLMQNPEQNINFEKILELNPDHQMFEKIQTSSNKADLITVIYEQTRLQEGLPIEDPKKFNELVYKLIK